MKNFVQYHNLDPIVLMDAWSDWVDHAARTWFESSHLEKFIIEFYKPGTTVALARWDSPIRHDGNGVDEMWLDRQFMQQSYAKSVALPPRCIYRILLLAPMQLSPNSPGVAPSSTVGDGRLKRVISSVAFSAGMNNIYFKYILSSSTTAGARLEGRVNDYVVTDNCLKCKYIDCVEV